MSAPATVRYLPWIAALGALTALAFLTFVAQRGPLDPIPLVPALLKLYGAPGLFVGIAMLGTATLTLYSAVRARDLTLVSIQRVLRWSLALFVSSGGMLFIDAVMYAVRWYGAWASVPSLTLGTTVVLVVGTTVVCSLFAWSEARAQCARQASWRRALNASC